MADAQYVIDIAAEMPEGAATAAQLDTLAAKLTGGGKAASYFTDAIAKADDQLAAAKATQVDAAAALATANTEYKALAKSVAMTEKAAAKMASKDPFDLEHTARDAAAARAALGEVENKLKSLRATEKSASAVVAKHEASLRGIKQLQGHVAKGYEQNAQKLEKLAGALNQLGGPLGRAAGGLVQKRKALGELEAVSGAANARMVMTAGIVAGVTFAVLAVTVAIVAATVAIAAWAIGLADANREAELSAEAFDAIHPKVAALRGEIDSLYASTSVSADQLQGWADKFTRAGFGAGKTATAMRALATAETALGKGGAEKFAARMMAGGDAVDRVARDIETKLGGIAAKRLQGLGAQSEKLKRSIAAVFGGLNIEPVLAAVGRLVGLFDMTTGHGKTLKFLFESVFQPLIDKADAAAYIVEAMFLGFQIAALKVYIGLKPVIRVLGEVFGFDTEGKGFADTLGLIVYVTEKLARAAIICGLAFGVLVAAAGAVIAVIVGIPIAIGVALMSLLDLGHSAIKWLGGVFGDVATWFAEYDWSKLGKSIVDGMVLGLTAGAHKVWSAMKSLADVAMGGAEQELEVHSPSKRSARLADNVAEGYVQATEKNEARVADASKSAYTLAPAEGASGITATPSAQARPALGPITNHFYGVKDGEHAAELVEDALTRILEGDALTLGGSAP